MRVEPVSGVQSVHHSGAAASSAKALVLKVAGLADNVRKAGCVE